ncbi:MAG: hypothetical protein OSB10_02605, partial [Planctomycetota bacterium]|nr:hypothetical protein [Planctomycetota bacterium]
MIGSNFPRAHNWTKTSRARKIRDTWPIRGRHEHLDPSGIPPLYKDVSSITKDDLLKALSNII